MDLLLDTVLKNASNVIGVMPTFLLEREISHLGLNELITVDNMSDRKAYMIEKGRCIYCLTRRARDIRGDYSIYIVG